MHTFAFIGLLASTIFSLSSAAALGRQATAKTASIAAYYGQAPGQDRLRTFCDDNSIDIFPIGFVNGFPNDPGNNDYPETNFGNQCGGYYGNTKTFLACSYFIEDIAYCQARGKKILISVGGGVSSGKLSSDADGTNFANQLWQIFGPKPCGYTGPRPFGDNVVDGFDLDIEQNGNTGVAALAAGLRAKMDSDTSKTYLLTAAPQCPIVDAQLGVALTRVRFDYVWVQFYNTGFCSARAHFDHSYGPDINFNSWVSWLKANSPSTPPKLFIGLPASPAAANSGYYLSLDEVKSLLTSLDSADLFGGIMLYDATYSRVNSVNSQTYASSVHALLDTRGFRRVSTTANNGYVYNCGSSTKSTVTSTATTVSSSSSRTVSTTSSSNPGTTSKPSSTTSTTTPFTTSRASLSTLSTTSTSSRSASITSSSTSRSTSTSTTSGSSSTPPTCPGSSSSKTGCTVTTTITLTRNTSPTTSSSASSTKSSSSSVAAAPASTSSSTTTSLATRHFAAKSSTSTTTNAKRQESSTACPQVSSTTVTLNSTVSSASLSRTSSGNTYAPTYTGGASPSIGHLSATFLATIACLVMVVGGLFH